MGWLCLLMLKKALFILVLSAQFVSSNVLAEAPAGEGAEQTQVSVFDIPQLNAADALAKLAEQADLQLLFPYQLAKSVQANPLAGAYSLQDAMALLLEGTVLEAKLSPRGFYKIGLRRRPVLREPVIRPLLEEIEEPEIEIMQISSRRSKLDKRLSRQKFSTAMVEGNSFSQDGRQIDEDVVDVLLNVSGTASDYRRREGVFVTVRGFGPEFNRVLYNNRQLPNSSAQDEFSLDTFSSGLFQESEVYKTPTSDLVSGGIGATINIKNSFNRAVKGHSGEFRLTQSRQGKGDSSPEFSFMHQYSGLDFSSLFSLEYSDQAYQIESANTDGWILADLSLTPNKSGATSYDEVWVPRNYDLRIETGTRQRLGASWLLEYQGSDDMTLSLDLLFSDLSVEAEIQSAATWTHVDGTLQRASQNNNFASIVVDANQTLLTYEYDPNRNFASDYVQLTRNRPSNLKQLGLNWVYDVTQEYRSMLDFSYAVAESDNGGKRRFSAVGSPNANPSYRYTPGAEYAELSYGNPVGVMDLKSHVTINTGHDLRDRISQIKWDNDLLLDVGPFQHLYLGLYHADRKKQKQAFRTPWGGEFGGYVFDLPDTLFYEVDASDFLDGGVPETWYSFNSDDYIDYLWSDEFIEREIKQADHWLADSIDERKAQGGFDAKFLPHSSWTISEILTEAYIRILGSGNWGYRAWSSDMGLRFARTQTESKGFNQTIVAIDYSPTDPTDLILTYDEPQAIKDENSYSHWLPHFNFKLDLSETQLLKLGLSKTISRPSLNRLAPAMGQYVARTGASSAVAGNPELKPYASTNIDFGWSWFFDNTGLFSITYFHKEIHNFILQSVELEQLLDHPEGEFLVVRPINLEQASVSGIEWGFQNKFESLPQPYNGLGVVARYTQASSDEGNIDNVGGAIEGLSDFYNFVAYYERGQLFASLSYQHRSEFVRKQSGAQGQPEMVEAYGQLDAKLSYELTPQFRVYAQGQNLLDSASRSFSIYKARLLSYEQRGPSFSLGIAAKF